MPFSSTADWVKNKHPNDSATLSMRPSPPQHPSRDGTNSPIEVGLPAPAVAFRQPDRSSQLRVRWAKLKRRIGNGSAPDESLGDPTTEATTSENGSSFGGKKYQPGSVGRGGGKGDGEKDIEPEEGVDEVVVEAPPDHQLWRASATKVGSSDRAGGTATNGGGTAAGITGGTNHQSDGSTFRQTAYESNGGVFGSVVSFLRWRLYPMTVNFFAPKYHDPAVEEAYQKEVWYTSKSTAIFGSCFLVFSWVLSISLLPHPWSLWNKIYNYVLGPILTIPLVPMAAFDVPRRQAWVWQSWVIASVFLAAAFNVIDMRLCNYYQANRTCGNRDFMGTLYYCASGPVISLFALGQRRFITFCACIAWIILVGAMILPVRVSYIRNVLNIALFQSFVIWIHYMREMADRRMYTLRAELKVQFRAKQKAQINERKTMDSKRRFSSYIFHEVRVPLNTALLAVQNLEGANVFDKNSEHAVEYSALESSLQMMSQVLNDVLDFSRMERGGFSSVSRPFAFHSVMRSIFVPLKLDAHARGLTLETSLDHRIDDVAKRAAFPDKEDSSWADGDGLMMGDEMRLRQVINNLASNACKFTSAGGTITIKTILIYPEHGPDLPTLDATGSAISDATSATYSPRLSANRLQQHEAKTSPPSPTGDEVLVARIEITDTGVGIRRRDMAENRLFSAYVQTEIGRHQGGKGTGLGLSLVRQIVMLSGGRLGVTSKVGEGSTFWVEMPFLIGPQTRNTDHLEPHRRVNTPATSDKSTSSTKHIDSPSSDIRFLPALTNRPSDPTLSSIGETDGAMEMAPVHYRFSPPASPSIESPSTFVPMDTSANLLARPNFKETVSSASAPPAVSTPRTPSPATSPTEATTTAAAAAQGRRGSASSIGRGKPASHALEFEDGPLRVLVVDDDVLTRKLMGRMMERLGAIVSTAENGKVALDMLLAGSATREGGGIDPAAIAPKHYDVTFLDNQMPLVSGLQVVNRMRSLGRDDLIIGVTANALLSDQEQYLEQGASFVLTKPVLETDLRRFLIIADRRRANAKHPARDTSAEPRTMFPPPVLIRSRDDD